MLRRDFVQDDAEREHVAAAVDIATTALLRCHVRELALDDSGLRLDAAHRCLRDTEVEQLHGAVVANHDVRRRHVAVHDAQRRSVRCTALVRVIEPRGRTGDDGQCELERNARASTTCLREHGAQVLPVHVLHREVVDAAFLADLEHLSDVLMVE